MADAQHTILVVDDNEDNLDLLARRLERKGYAVVRAMSGALALSILESANIDLVVLDIMMPEMDGLEVLSELRKTRSLVELPVIVATAQSAPEEVVRALDLGANDHVIKPIDFEVLHARIRAHLRQRSATRSSMSSAPPGSARVLESKYQLEHKLGTGGFGTVYRARHLALDTHVAIKMLHAHLAESTSVRARFAREGISACRVRHPNAVAVLDAGTTAEGVPYLVMEFLEGPSLYDELQRERVLPLAQVARIGVPICEVLREAHRAGVIHRDIKPGNILLASTPVGQVVKVLDFGIAKLLDGVLEAMLTGDQVLGTPNYMAPERLLGKHTDERSDIYSVGAVLYEMMACRLPFGEALGSPFSQALRQLQSAPTSLAELRPDLPAEVVEMVMACLAPEPTARPDLEHIERTLLTWGQTFKEPVWPPPDLPNAGPHAGRAMASTLSAEESLPEAPADPSTIKPTHSATDAEQPETRSEVPPRKIPRG